MKAARVLFLEDEMQLARIVSETLQNRGFSVSHFNNGRLGLEAIYKSAFDICLVDIMMPFMDGLTFANELRKTDKHIPILFLTAKSQDKDVIGGYSAGGNDYLKKPFSLEELLLRMNELLKRNQHQAHSTTSITIGAYVFFPKRQELSYNGLICAKLSHRETELLFLLASHKNELLHRKATLLRLWGDDSPFNARTMDVFITRLRKHLQEDSTVEIINIRGHGYKLLC